VPKVAAEVGSTANSYQILAQLAVGGMAEIFLARSVGGVERYCVLKRVLSERATDPLLVEMFVDEARLAAQLQHPNIASVYDIGMMGDSYFFTMEYVHGQTLRAIVDRAHDLRRALPVACVLTIVAGAAAGLHHAHERNSNDGRPLGIVHRDVSPSNLMVSYEGHVKLVDFGVAKAADRANETKAGTVKGKIGYLSPEQCRGARVDRRSDLFSLGIVLWETLTGARLYRRAGDFETMAAIVGEPPPPPSELRPEVPREIDQLVQRLLAKSPDERFQRAADVVEAIEHGAMRGGMILSTSAVSRLVHELFGTRVEPWLAVDPASVRQEATVALAADDVMEVTASIVLDDLDDAMLISEVSEVSEISEINAREAIELPLARPRASQAAIPNAPADAPRASRASIPSLSAGARASQPAIPRTIGDSPSERAARQDEPTAIATSPTRRRSAERLPSHAIDAAVPPSSPELTPFPMVTLAPQGFPPGPASQTERVASGRRSPWPMIGMVTVATMIGVGVGAAWLAFQHHPTPDPGHPVSAAIVPDAAPRVVEPPPAPPPAPPAPPPAATFEALSTHYDARDYAGVVAACRAAVTTSGITTICLMAACHLGDAAQARRWLALHPRARRAQLATTCEQLGSVRLDDAARGPR